MNAKTSERATATTGEYRLWKLVQDLVSPWQVSRNKVRLSRRERGTPPPVQDDVDPYIMQVTTVSALVIFRLRKHHATYAIAHKTPVAIFDFRVTERDSYK